MEAKMLRGMSIIVIYNLEKYFYHPQEQIQDRFEQSQ
jgi:hypothetical protein